MARPGSLLTLGGRVPPVVGGLIAATVLTSLVSVVGSRNGLPLLSLLAFSPQAVLQGQVWRLVTWVLLETDPLNLLFGALVLFWFGRDLAEAWGERRFLVVYLGVAAVAAAATTLLSLAWPALRGSVWTGLWPAADGLVVAWALLFPFRQILLFFALPVSGRALLWFTIGATVLYALFAGVAAFVPHLLAEGAMWLHASGLGPGRWLRKIRWPRRRGRGRFEVIHVDRDPDRKWLN
jgi:membrane associated rhomboid family serine protease